MAGEVDELLGAQERLIVAQTLLSKTSEVAERGVLRKRMEAARRDRDAALTAVKDAAKAGDPEAVAAIDFFEKKKAQRD